MELYFGIFFFLNNVYNVTLLPDGSIYALVISFIQMCLHMYVYIRFIGINDWKEFIKHRTAEKIIKSLSDATTIQLSELNDICAICIQNMVSAKITQCNHYFHAACLRKLLYKSDQVSNCLMIFI